MAGQGQTSTHIDIVLLLLLCTTELKPAGSCKKADPHQELQTLLFPSPVLLTPHTVAATGGDDAGLPGGPSASPLLGVSRVPLSLQVLHGVSGAM